MAKATFAGNPSLNLTNHERQIVFDVARSELADATSQIVSLRGGLGMQEEKISTSQARVDQSLAQLSIDRLEMIKANQFEKATELEAAQQKLNALYRIAARQSRTGLAEYMR